MKNLLIALVVIIVLLVAGWFLFFTKPAAPEPAPQGTDTPATSTPAVEDDGMTVVGQSEGGHPITAYHFGTGEKEVLFVGGIHGGYSPNTTLVARELMDYLTETPSAVPTGVKVTVIPVLNPDGLQKTLGTVDEFDSSDIPTGDRSPGRFNDNGVDLNRNFDCDWKASAVWQSKNVSGGTAIFSEQETAALKAYIDGTSPDAVIVWYSAAGGVYSSNCHTGILPETKTLTNLFAKASGYPAHEEFDFYETTGDLTNWLAKEGIPAISVLLTTHTDAEWTKNKAGIDAVLEHYGE